MVETYGQFVSVVTVLEQLVLLVGGHVALGRVVVHPLVQLVAVQIPFNEVANQSHGVMVTYIRQVEFRLEGACRRQLLEVEAEPVRETRSGRLQLAVRVQAYINIDA